MIQRSILLLLVMSALSLPAGAEQKLFLAFGDSITVGHGDGPICPDPEFVAGYPQRLRTRLAPEGVDAVFANHGECGEKTAVGLTRIDSVLSGGGDVIIIMEGTNDVSMFVGFETTVFNLNMMAEKALAAGVEPVMSSLVPRGPEANTDTNNGKTFRIGDELRMDSEENGWAFADPFSRIFYLPPDYTVPRTNFFELYFFDQLHPNPIGYNLVADSMVDAAVQAANTEQLCAQVPPGPCVSSSTVLCLNQSRFRLEAVWKNFFEETGVGQALQQTDDTGVFYWVDPQNIELMIKVLDGRVENNHFWVFYGAMSNLEFTLVVTDTETGECNEYVNPLGTFASVGDTSAFFDDGLEPPP